MNLSKYPSPIGDILLVTEDDKLLALDFADYEARMRRLVQLRHGPVTLTESPAPVSVVESLDRYFAGDLTALDTLALDTGGTAFQQRVWSALRQTKPGETTTYGEIGRRIGHASASRAVGAANGANAIAIVIPCHRIVASTGALTGYAGGLDRKRWLLDHELQYSAAVR
ncbi:MAG: methylated-DNA--[protein]-cysteine S-methyltransferase [Bryobacteraceae bacterium]